MAGRHENLIFTDLPRMVDLPSHFHPVPFWVSPDMGEEVNLGVAAVDASKLVGQYLTDAHEHECAEVYMALSPNRGDMVLEITLYDETYTVESPCVIYVPPGVSHRFKTLKCEKEGSYFYGLLLNMDKA